MTILLTAHELADFLNLTVETVWSYTQQYKIPVLKLSEEQYRYDKEAVLAALKDQPVPAKERQPEYSEKVGYTYADYLKIPEEPGCRYEVLEGILVKEPSPSVRHQRVTSALYRRLADYFDLFDPEGEVFFAPLDMTLSNHNVLQPDILYVSSAGKAIKHKERIDGPVDLVVEVISPAKRRKDRLYKMEIYCKAGIPHYWLADPEEKTLETFMLKGGHYTLVFAGAQGDQFAHPEFPGLDLDLEKVFRRSGAE
ncbi:MAG: Uma2 family endonuclease [Dethiobacter sp.]|jgi:Uma2 family endonuclease|nr:Uma2 family endonuclease [Dethiobacter sp.]